MKLKKFWRGGTHLSRPLDPPLYVRLLACCYDVLFQNCCFLKICSFWNNTSMKGGGRITTRALVKDPQPDCHKAIDPDSSDEQLKSKRCTSWYFTAVPLSYNVQHVVPGPTQGVPKVGYPPSGYPSPGWTWLGYPPPQVWTDRQMDGWTDTCQNITFPRTTYAVGNKTVTHDSKLLRQHIP